MKANVLYLALTFPRIGESNNLYTDLMEEFKERGHQVYILASSLETGAGGYAIEGGLHVIRAKVPKHQNVGNIKKGISNLLLPFAYRRALKKHLPKDIQFDLIITPTPPITLAGLAARLKRKYKAKYYLILRDIFPQNAVDLGFISKSGLLYRFFRAMEKRMYANADHIGCMSQGNIDYVKKHNPGIEQDKLHLLRNWQKPSPAVNKTKQELKEQFGLKGQFVLFFGGNIGKPQRIENLIALAKYYKNDNQISLLIVGRGTEFARLKNTIDDEELGNMQLLDALPRDEYFQVMQMADIGLISLDERFTIPNLPSKVLSYFNAKLPVVAIIDENTDFGSWVQDDIKAGFWNTIDNFNTIVEKIEFLRSNKEFSAQLGQNGYDYFCEQLLVENAYQTIMSRIDDEVV